MRIVVYVTVAAAALGVVGVSALGPRVRCGLCGGPIDAANMQMKGLSDAMDMYRIDRAEMPSSLDVLTLPSARTGEPYVDRLPLDPWGRPYLLRVGTGGGMARSSRAAGSAPTRPPCADSGARTLDDLRRTRMLAP